MKKHLLIALFIITLVVGCTLKRSNPLDANSHDLVVPQEITGLLASHSAANAATHWVRLTWDRLPMDNADGYYVYRGKTWDGTYERLNPVINMPDSTNASVSFQDNGSDLTGTTTGIVPGYYYYKVSAYKQQNPRDPHSILEGHISPYVGTDVPQ